MIEQFKRDIVFGIGRDESTAGSERGFFKEATFDDVSLNLRESIRTGAIESGGIAFGTSVGNTLLVSASGPNELFADVHPLYPIMFQPFSPPGVLTLSSELVPNLTLGARADHEFNAFGAVFVDVDDDTSLSIYTLQQDISIRFSASVPATPGDGNLSFVGVIFDGTERYAGVVFQQSMVPFLPMEGQQLEDPDQDFVAFDNIIIGLAVPEPAATEIAVLGGLGLLVFSAMRKRLRRVG